MRTPLLLLISLYVTSCAILFPQPSAPELLLEPSTLGRGLSTIRTVHIEIDGKTYSSQFAIEIYGNRLAIVNLSPFGLVLSQIEYVGLEEPRVTSIDKGSAFDPRFILFDIYMTYWPEQTLRQNLAEIGIRFDQNSRDGTRKAFAADGNIIAEVSFVSPNAVDEKVIIRHYDLQYVISILPGGETS